MSAAPPLPGLIHPRIAALLWCCLPATLVLFVYVPAIFNGFIWDDWFGLVEMPYMNVREQEWLLVGGSQYFSANFFRPITTLFHVIEHRLLEPYPVYFHLTNIALHVCNTLLLTLISRRFHKLATGSFSPTAIAVPLLYGLHPALVEPVAWISGRVDLIVTLFLLLALWLDMTLRAPWPRALLVALAYLCALLSKEMAAPFPLVLFCWHLALNNQPLRPLASWWHARKRDGTLLVYICLSFAACIYLAARRAVLGHLLSSEGAAPDGIDSIWEHLLLVGAAYGEVLLIASGPLTDQLPLHFIELPLTLSSNHVWLGLVIIAILLCYLVTTRLHIPALGWLWLALPIALLPISNLVPIRTGPGFMAERFLTFPLALATIAVSATATSTLRHFPTRIHSHLLWAVTLIWLIASGITVQRQIPRWENDLALWQWSATVLPNSGYARLNYVYALKGQGRYAEAIEVCRDSLGRIEEKYIGDIRRNLGFLYLAVGQPAAAVTELEASLARHEGTDEGKHTQRDVLGRRQASNNRLYVIYLNLGNALMELQREEEALRYFEKSVELEPDEPAAFYNLGLYNLEHGNAEAAIDFFEKALIRYQATRKGRQNQLYVVRGIADTEKMLVKARQLKRNH